MKRKSIFYLFVLLASVLIQIQCIAQTTKYNVKSGHIPPDFKGYDHTLLVLKHERSWNKIAEKALKANYTGKYVFVSRDDINKPEYSDITEYRFILTKNNYIIAGRGMDLMVTGKAATEDLSVFDRKTSKQYSTKNSTSFIGKQFKEYLKALEQTRQEK